MQPRAAASGVLVGREVAGHAAAHARLARRGGLGRLLRGLNETDAARLAVIRIGLEVHGGIHALTTVETLPLSFVKQSVQKEIRRISYEVSEPAVLLCQWLGAELPTNQLSL